MSKLNNRWVFAGLYLLLMLPTYLLPYLGSNSALAGAVSAVAGWGPPLPWWWHMWCLGMLVLLAWLRGQWVRAWYLPLLSALAGVFDMVPGLNWVPLAPSVFHSLALWLGFLKKPLDADAAPLGHGDHRESSSGGPSAARTRTAWIAAASISLMAAAGSAFYLVRSSSGPHGLGRQPAAPSAQPSTAPGQESKAPLAEPKEWSYRDSSGTTVRVWPGLPAKPERVSYELKPVSRHSLAGYQGFGRLKADALAYAQASGVSETTQLQAGALVQVLKILVTEVPQVVRYKGPRSDQSGNTLKAGQVIHLLKRGDESRYDLVWFEGEARYSESFDAPELSQLDTLSPGSFSAAWQIRTREGKTLWLRDIAQPPIDETSITGWDGWSLKRTHPVDKSFLRSSPSTTAQPVTLIDPGAEVEVLDDGQEWLKTRLPKSQTQGFLRRDRVTEP